MRATEATVAPGTELLKRTTSRCPVCGRLCPAEVFKVGETPARVILERTCAEHGTISECIASAARFYWLAHGRPANACGCSGGDCQTARIPPAPPNQALRAADLAPAGTLGRNAAAQSTGAFESLSTCVALIEVVDSCNLACPTCYADSPAGVGSRLAAPPVADLKARIQGVIDRKGKIDILQLSGGEPTLHPDFFDLLTWAQAHPRIDYVLLNTNGVRLARDDAFVDQLRRTFRYGKMQVYLQFDGPQLEGQVALRGADLRAVRTQAIEHCGRIGLPLTLAMTVTPETLPHVWATIEFGLGYAHVRGVAFQPRFASGRLVLPGSSETDRVNGRRAGGAAAPRITAADIILAAVESSRGQLQFSDFTPLPCGDPNCAVIGYLFRLPTGIRSISEFVDFANLQGFLHDRLRYEPADLEKCGCESEPLGRLLKRLEVDEKHTFRLFIKPFMDAWSWDQDRIDRCCTHVIRPDGKLDSFCRYYSGFADTRGGP
jgi:uncharacterized radical SAM superfamily Fe-S cluster-containing enzyme